MVRSQQRVLRSWPWTIALAAVAGVVLLIGMIAFSNRSSWFGFVLSLVTVGAALTALFRVLTSGVYVLPSGIIIRELTRSTPVPWPRVRSITTEPTAARRRAQAPVLTVLPVPGPGQTQQNAKNAEVRVEVTILASYQERVAKRRTQELIDARAAATRASGRAGR